MSAFMNKRVLVVDSVIAGHLMRYLGQLFSWDVISCTTQIDQKVFNHCVNSTAMFIQRFDGFKKRRIIP